jgi:tRNA pseudouridine55 synthase
MKRSKGFPINGWLILDKPQGVTSTHALSRVKRLFEARKAGHAGTLDPLATGILPIAFGEATKTVPYVFDGEKSYLFTVRWGVETNTDDSEGQEVRSSELRPDRAAIEAVMEQFRGEIMQTPPQFSAIKVSGERAYDLARDGESFELAARKILVKRLEIDGEPAADSCAFVADCGKGAYVRALARDMGRTLGCFGHVIALRRTRVGPFMLADSVTMEMLHELAAPPPPAVAAPEAAAAEDAEATAEATAEGAAIADAQARARETRARLLTTLKPVEAALGAIPGLAINSSDAGRLRRGQGVIMRGRDAPIINGPVYVTLKGTLIALGEVSQGEFKPSRVFTL